MEDEVMRERRDYGRWMQREEPRGFRPGTRDFRENVTVVRERAGAMAAEDDRRRLGDAEFERRVDARRAKYGGRGAAAAEERKDSGVASVGDEVGDEVDEEDVLVVGEEGPKGVSFSMRELERQLSRRGEDLQELLPSRRQMMESLLSMKDEELAKWKRQVREGETSGRADGREAEREKGKGKGKGKGSSGRRESEAEERHVQRQKEGRGK